MDTLTEFPFLFAEFIGSECIERVERDIYRLPDETFEGEACHWYFAVARSAGWSAEHAGMLEKRVMPWQRPDEVAWISSDWTGGLDDAR